MAPEGEGASNSERTSSELGIAAAIRVIAAKNARADLADESQLVLFLRSWWSRHYNRPLKDPLLQSYTLEDLLYEFYDRIERRAAEEERLDREGIREEETKEKVDLDWAEQMEKDELEQLKAKAAAEEVVNQKDPTKDIENIEWMEEQMRLAKAQHGESFGEDIEEKFNE